MLNWSILRIFTAPHLIQAEVGQWIKIIRFFCASWQFALDHLITQPKLHLEEHSSLPQREMTVLGMLTADWINSAASNKVAFMLFRTQSYDCLLGLWQSHAIKELLTNVCLSFFFLVTWDHLVCSPTRYVVISGLRWRAVWATCNTKSLLMAQQQKETIETLKPFAVANKLWFLIPFQFIFNSFLFI